MQNQNCFLHTFPCFDPLENSLHLTRRHPSGSPQWWQCHCLAFEAATRQRDGWLWDGGLSQVWGRSSGDQQKRPINRPLLGKVIQQWWYSTENGNFERWTQKTWWWIFLIWRQCVIPFCLCSWSLLPCYYPGIQHPLCAGHQCHEQFGQTLTYRSVSIGSGRKCLVSQSQHTAIISTGWWYTYPSEKYEFVSWDDDIPNIWKNKIHVPNHQPDIIWVWKN